MALLAVLFASLGTWQTRRATEKTALEMAFEQAPRASLETALDKDQRYARVNASGHFDPQRHVLLDNQVWRGRIGVHVFTPFVSDSGISILVNRGWLPLPADRLSLPEIPTPDHPITLSGIFNLMPMPGRMVGEADTLVADDWPQLVTYMQHVDIARALAMPLETQIIQLSWDAEYGFEDRDWKPVFLSSERHRAYAFQWYALMSAAILLWLLTSFRKIPGNNR